MTSVLPAKRLHRDGCKLSTRTRAASCVHLLINEYTVGLDTLTALAIFATGIPSACNFLTVSVFSATSFVRRPFLLPPHRFPAARARCWPARTRAAPCATDCSVAFPY